MPHGPAGPRLYAMRPRLAAALTAGLLTLLAGWWVTRDDPTDWPLRETRALSGGWTAQVRADPQIRWLAMPGQGSDGRGAVIFVAPDGRACGTVIIPIVGDVTLDEDADVASVGRPAFGTVDKARCALR